MPLRIADSSTQPSSLKTVPEKYLIFYSSVVDGKMWRPSCVAMDNQVQQIFGAADGPSDLIIYVGDRQECKAPDNIFRGEPWKLKCVPTIIKLKEAEEVGRFVDGDVSGLASFVKE